MGVQFFLIADQNEAYVLETAGRSWAVKKAGEVETISNCLGLRADYEAASAGVSGDFRRAYQTISLRRLPVRISAARLRAPCSAGRANRLN